MLTVVDQLPRFGKRELVCLLLFTCNYVVSVWRCFLFLWVLGMGYVILLWHSLSLPCNYFESLYSLLGLVGVVDQGSIVPSIVSLTTSLRRQLVKYMPTTYANTPFLWKKLRMQCKRFSHFPNKQCTSICNICVKMFTNEVVNFE